MSEARSYYVYALKDPRSNPSRPFYIGKGTGVRAWEHQINIDGTRKGKRIQEIVDADQKPVVTKLVEGLTENEALLIESELIAAFGTESQGGLLTNSVIPLGKKRNSAKDNLIIPSGVVERAQIGVALLKESVLELAVANEEGVTNSDIVHTLGLHSDYSGGSKDYLSWSILGLLMREGKIRRVEKKKHKAQVR
ncbi:MAG: GIY-YIG nuclease family protein [Terracidiphilus sp.]